MKKGAVHAMALAFEALNGFDQKAGLFLNAAPLPGLDAPVGLTCEQGLRPIFRELQNRGYAAEPEIGEQTCQYALVLSSRNRRMNEANLARAWNACEEGGTLIVAGEKTSGIAPLKKAMQALGPVHASAKYHANVLRMARHGPDLPVPELQSRVDGYAVAEGMFSADGPDMGSKLLVQHFSGRVKGKVADLGSGWGYLSAELLKRVAHVTKLDLYEADWRSLEAARDNVADPRAQYHWLDVTRELPVKPYDWVIMNPPFHIGRAAEPGLGQAFIKAAAGVLPKSSRLLMVANRNLPYEHTISNMFRSFEMLEETQGFKVIEALR